jgi:hypothetical protein
VEHGQASVERGQASVEWAALLLLVSLALGALVAAASCSIRRRGQAGRALLTRAGSYLRRHHIALLALFIALGGTSYAAIKLPANSVGSAQLKNRAVTPKKVSPAAVKLFRGKRGPRGATGATGATGAVGAQGPQGQTGPPGGTAWSFVTDDTGGGSEDPVGTDTTVLSLPGAGIVTGFNSGLVGTATLTLTQTAVGASEVACRLNFPGAADPEVSQRVTMGGTGDIKPLTLAAATSSRPPGTYDVNVICTETGAGSTGFRAGALTVHAAAG